MYDLQELNIELREERLEDYRETENVVREAFWNVYTPGCKKHYLVHIMRDSSAFIPELDVVAVHNREIIGNIVYLKSAIQADDGNEYEVLSLGPIAVLPEYQGKGVGTQMIEYTRRLAREMGYCAILLCGDPNYYTRQGFVLAENFGIRTSEDMYFPALHVCGLYEDALCGLKGRYFEDGIYNVDEEVVADSIRNFHPKKRLRVHRHRSDLKKPSRC